MDKRNIILVDKHSADIMKSVGQWADFELRAKKNNYQVKESTDVFKDFYMLQSRVVYVLDNFTVN